MPDDLNDLLEFLSTEERYRNVRVLGDGTIVGTRDLMFTRALYIDLDRCGWHRRYCYENRDLADQAAQQLTNGDEEPLAGWIAKRPEQ